MTMAVDDRKYGESGGFDDVVDHVRKSCQRQVPDVVEDHRSEFRHALQGPEGDTHGAQVLMTQSDSTCFVPAKRLRKFLASVDAQGVCSTGRSRGTCGG